MLLRLSQQYPASRINVVTITSIESDERKAIGEDFAKDLVPVIGNPDIKFEREALLMFYNRLNEQCHLAAVMVGLEPDPVMRNCLEMPHAHDSHEHGPRAHHNVISPVDASLEARTVGHSPAFGGFPRNIIIFAYIYRLGLASFSYYEKAGLFILEFVTK